MADPDGHGGRSIASILLAGALIGLGTTGPTAAPYGLGPPLSLPTTLRGTVQVPAEQDDGRPIETLRALYTRLAACWRSPAGLARLERTEVTARFALRRDGSVIGEPRITFATQPTDSKAFQLLADAARDAIRRCTPAGITPGLGGAIAGRPIALRFIYEGPKGQGV
ncbi:hypothetical protein [uncultured Methylobacterium sp.]|uniref:hypothetical protein n=1 Tax=uncultured Methylobacterium sp. TaxID=157278 RepID=UPI0035CA071C